MKRIPLRAFYSKVYQWIDIIKGTDFILGLTNDEANTSKEIAVAYAPTFPPIIRKIFNDIGISSYDIFVDFGCGKGFVLKTAHEYPFKEIRGVELSEKIANIAKNNAEKLKWENVKIICCDARDYSDIDSSTIFYFYNPFPRQVFVEVINNIINSIRLNPRKVILVYRNPKYADIIENNECFNLKKVYPATVLSPHETKVYECTQNKA